MFQTYVIGAGGLGKETASAIENQKEFEFGGYFDDRYDLAINDKNEFIFQTVKEATPNYENSSFFGASEDVLARAESLKKYQTKQEKTLYRGLKANKLHDAFIDKYPINNLIVDFYSEKAKVVLQIGDGILSKLYESEIIKKHNIKILRFHNYEIDSNIQGVMSRINTNLVNGHSIEGIKNLKGGKGKFKFNSINEVNSDIQAIISVGNPQLKEELYNRISSEKVHFVSFIHNKSNLEKRENIRIGSGTIIQSGAQITTDVTIGRHVLINLNVSVGHDSIIGDFSSLMPGVHVSGAVNIGKRVLIGSGAVLLQGIKVGNDAVIGAGAVVTSDVPSNVTVIGIPARPLSK